MYGPAGPGVSALWDKLQLVRPAESPAHGRVTLARRASRGALGGFLTGGSLIPGGTIGCVAIPGLHSRTA